MRIQLRVNPVTRRSWMVVCPGCGHDAFHSPLDELTGALPDAYHRAEQMFNDHLYGFDVGVRSCPVERLDLLEAADHG